MPEESTTPDLVELVRESIEAANNRDIDAALGFYGPDAAWDMSPVGMGTLEGAAAIRAFMEEWLGSYEEFEMEPEEIRDLGDGVGFVVIRQGGRPIGSTGHVQMRYAAVSVWVGGLAVRVTTTPTSTRPVVPPNGLPSRGGSRCHRSRRVAGIGVGQGMLS